MTGQDDRRRINPLVFLCNYKQKDSRAESSRDKRVKLTIDAIQAPNKHIEIIRTGDNELVLRPSKGAALHGAGIEVFVVIEGAQRFR